jgi:hypothetical protein
MKISRTDPNRTVRPMKYVRKIAKPLLKPRSMNHRTRGRAAEETMKAKNTRIMISRSLALRKRNAMTARTSNIVSREMFTVIVLPPPNVD